MNSKDRPEEIKRCPKTGRIISSPPKKQKSPSWKILVLPIMGFISLLWFLIRVIPKPSRATYPCMKAAAPAAASFVAWLGGIFGLSAFIKTSKENARRARYISAISIAAIGLIFAFIFSISGAPSASKAFVPPDAPNSPMGTAKGIFPGRVTWVRNPNATTWNGTTGFWWEGTNTNQSSVDAMVSDSLRALTGKSDDSASWDAIFKHFNQDHGKGNIGYASSEKIAIKINCNNTRDSHAQQVNNINPSPQLLLSLLRQLISQAGVPQGNITVYDASRYITDNIYSYCKNQFPNVVFVDQNGGDGRIARVWSASVIRYAQSNYCGDRIPTVVAEANYLIDMPIMKAHPMAGMTLSAKNHYGTLNGLDHTLCRPYNTYNPFVDFMGDKDLGGKTLINILDGLYGAKHSDTIPEKWKSKPFNGTWPASIFMSLDQVALDSVGFDFLNSEMGTSMMANSDSYLHEEALAANPPSGAVYAPDGVRLGSLGVHEHWNNADEKKYTRNLGTGSGIELVSVGGSTTPQVSSPSFSPGGGIYASAQSVAISCATAGATIRFTTDGSTPTSSSPAYTAPVQVSTSTTIKAYATSPGMTDSPIVSATYTIGTQSLTIPGKIEAESYISMSNVQTEACSEGTLNVGWIDTGDWMDYTVNVQSAGTYSVEYRVSSPNTTGQVQIRSGTSVLSTTNIPSTGGWQNWQTVTGTVTLPAGSQTLRIHAGTGGWNLNWINFSSSAQQIAAPVISPSTGTYASAQTVTITTATSGATIRYTRDGSTPTASTGTIYSAPFSLSDTATIRAIAYKAGMADSAVTASTITISSTPINLALNMSSAESSHEGGFASNGAFDGNTATRWSSEFSDPQWIRVDLGSVKTISRVRLNWENAYGKAYKVQVSMDGAQWADVYETATGDGNIDDISFAATSAKFVRMYGTQRATGYGYSLWEFEVY